MTSGSKPHLVVIGFDDIVSDKYISCIAHAIEAQAIDGYSIVDLASERATIEQRVAKLSLKPENIYYLPDPRRNGQWADIADFEPIVRELTATRTIKVYIATELKAHLAYLTYCIEHSIDSLVEKPIFGPLRDGQFEPTLIEPTMQSLIAQVGDAKHSVMTLSRYHHVYNETVIEPLKAKMLELNAPLTSYHFRTAGGVWNLHREYESREDHPYKYGYGMLMHGGYHYIDLSVQFLLLNKLIYPTETFTLTVSSFAAYPKDQNDRISKTYSAAFEDDCPHWADADSHVTRFGETDITTTFCLTNKRTGNVLTLGTLSFEQTTPSIRAWKDIPPDTYNKNGRASNVDLEAQLSVLHSVNVQCFDVPTKTTDGELPHMDAFARVSTRTNASLLTNDAYTTEQTFTGLFHSDSNRALMTAWLLNQESRSQFTQHFPVMRTIQALAESIKHPGQPVTFDLM